LPPPGVRRLWLSGHMTYPTGADRLGERGTIMAVISNATCHMIRAAEARETALREMREALTEPMSAEYAQELREAIAAVERDTAVIADLSARCARVV